MNQKIIRLVYVSVFMVALYGSVYAQDGNISTLKINEIMQGDRFVGHLPSNIFWALNSKTIYFEWNTDNSVSDSMYQYSTDTKKITKVSEQIERNLPPSKLMYSKDGAMALYEKRGDIFLLNMADNQLTQITNTINRESGPHFTNNDSRVAFMSGDNIFTWEIRTGKLEQVTDFSGSGDNDKTENLNDNEKWLQNDQLELFSVIKERNERKVVAERNEKKQEIYRPLSISLKGMNLMRAQMSPDGNFVTYIVYKRAKSRRTIVPNFVTKSGYTQDINARPKVGEQTSDYQIYLYDIKNRKTVQVEFDNLKGIDEIPAFAKEYPDKKYENKSRVGFIQGPFWNQHGTKAFIEMRANDNKDRWIALLDIETGKLTQLERQHDDAWIDGPGIGFFSGYDNALGWMPDGKSIWFQSEETGYSHLYMFDIQSKKKKALTRGQHEVFNPFISKDKQHWYFSSNELHPGEVQFYRMPLMGGKAEQITKMTGNNQVHLSPDETKIAIRYSFSNKPWEIYLMNNPVVTGIEEEPVQLTKSTTDNFRAYPWRVPENISFKAHDSEMVYARLYKPNDEIKNNAAIIFVHGAGYLQNAHKWWSGYFREYMFHNLLVDNGFTVLDIDYRGSAGYGRDWRTGIYRHMGGKDLTDQVDGAKYLIKNFGIDENKVGIYGGSYGGFITIMAMFKEGDTFMAGAAIRSVTDWAHYNHAYTSNILNTPVADSIAYRQSSPIYYADGLKGHLLMLHGMVDDNVHFQDVVRLSQKLIELGKKNWDIAIYPVERHGFVEPSSWIDEYTRIFNLFKETLTD